MKFSKLLNILGMTVAFAALYIILVQVHYDLTYNRAIKDSERIYVMTMISPRYTSGGVSAHLARPFAEMIIAENPYIEEYAVTQLDNVGQNYVIVGDGSNAQTHAANVAQMTSKAFDVFGIDIIVGSVENIATDNYVAISKKAAKRLGVGVDSVINIESWGVLYPFTICAIYEDLPIASDLQNIEIIRCNQLEEQDLYSSNNWSYNHMVKLFSPDDKSSIEKTMDEKYQEFIEKQIAGYKAHKGLDGDNEEIKYIREQFGGAQFELLSIRDLYFSGMKYSVGQTTGNFTTTMTLLIMAILIVIITLINYVNFFFAQVPMRIRSVNTRKILGSSRIALVGQFLAESAILVVVSLLLAVAIVKLFQFSEYADFVSLTLDFQANWVVTLFTITVALLMTLISGLYPAMYATSFSPAFAIKGSFGMTAKGKTLRYALIGLQFVISLAFIICAIFLKLQHSYMMNFDMGFDKECLVTATIPLNNIEEREAFNSELLNNPNIKAVAWSQNRMVTPYRMEWERWYKGETISLTVMPVSWNFLQVMGIEVIEGRDFLPSDEKGDGAIILNEYAKKKYNINLDDKIAWDGIPIQTTGFCKDFLFEPLHYESKEFAFYIHKSDILDKYYTTPYLTVRTIEKADIKAVFDAIRTTTDKILPDYGSKKVMIHFFDEELGENYEKEQQLTTTISLFTLLAIIISLMGVLGLVLFETQYRRKEIAIRRVNGATVDEILLMLNRKFMIIVGICFLIVAPISYFITDYYYSTFAYRAPIYWWVFLLAFAMVAVITAIVVTVASFHSASINPIRSLKSE